MSHTPGQLLRLVNTGHHWYSDDPMSHELASTQQGDERLLMSLLQDLRHYFDCEVMPMSIVGRVTEQQGVPLRY
jgi:hypothetical protein